MASIPSALSSASDASDCSEVVVRSSRMRFSRASCRSALSRLNPSCAASRRFPEISTSFVASLVSSLMARSRATASWLRVLVLLAASRALAAALTVDLTSWEASWRFSSAELRILPATPRSSVSIDIVERVSLSTARWRAHVFLMYLCYCTGGFCPTAHVVKIVEGAYFS